MVARSQVPRWSCAVLRMNAGSLMETPVCYLTYPQSVAGPPWRLETATYGPFQHRHFEDRASLLATIEEELSLRHGEASCEGRQSTEDLWSKDEDETTVAEAQVQVASFDDHGPRQKDVQMSATPVQAQKADKAQKLSRKQRKKIRLESETSVKPQASPKSRAAASPKAKAAVPSPKMAPEQMDIDVESLDKRKCGGIIGSSKLKSKKQRRKEQRRSIQVKKTQMKKKGNY
eukprot:g25469.t1